MAIEMKLICQLMSLLLSCVISSLWKILHQLNCRALIQDGSAAILSGNINITEMLIKYESVSH